jgi:hypothetical protein
MQTLPTLRLTDQWMRDHLKAGRTTTRARAAFISVDHSTVSRVEAETKAPGPEFIAKTLIAFYPRKFERYFEVVTQR